MDASPTTNQLFGRPVDLICFDLDDTLVDTESGAAARFEAAARALVIARPDIARSLIDNAIERGLATHPTEGRMANFLADLGLAAPDEVMAVRAAYFAGMADGMRLDDGIIDVLDALHDDFRLAIVTNGPSELQRSKIERFGLIAHVDFVVISGEVGYEKPDRAIFDHTRGLAGSDAARTAHVGDSLTTDIAGANAAGLLSIWVRSALVRARPDEARMLPRATISHVRELIG